MIGAKIQSIRTVQAYVNPDEGTGQKLTCYTTYEEVDTPAFSIIKCDGCIRTEPVMQYSDKSTCKP